MIGDPVRSTSLLRSKERCYESVCVVIVGDEGDPMEQLQV